MSAKKKDRIAAELQRIYRADGQKLNPASVVEFARNPKTALHGKFEWDDTKAGHEYRLWQAREVIAAYVTVIRKDAPPVRAWVSIGHDRVSGGGYRATVDVMKDPGLRIRMLLEAQADLSRLETKYQALMQTSAPFAGGMRALRSALSKEIRQQRQSASDAA